MLIVNSLLYSMATEKLIICVFGCATIPHYRKEIDKINLTWRKRADELSVRVLFFLGEEKTDLVGDEYIYLPGVGNDYNSASHKQNLGLKYIYEKFDADFVYVCGTDTYVNVDSMLNLLSNYSRNDNVFIGGHGFYINMGDIRCYMHSGGSGFIIPRMLHTTIYPYLEGLFEECRLLCVSYKHYNLIPACDFQIAYIIKKFGCGTRIIDVNEMKSCDIHGNNNREHKCLIDCCQKVSMIDIIACHYMTFDVFDEYYYILHTNNYFVGEKRNYTVRYVDWE